MTSEPVPVCLYFSVCVGRCVLICWSHVADVGCSSDLAMRRLDVTTEKSTDSTSLFGISTNMVIELQLCVNANSKHFAKSTVSRVLPCIVQGLLTGFCFTVTQRT